MASEAKKTNPSGNEIEYAFGSVPKEARKSFSTILVILTGYTISLSNFVTGATIGSICAARGTEGGTMTPGSAF